MKQVQKHLESVYRYDVGIICPHGLSFLSAYDITHLALDVSLNLRVTMRDTLALGQINRMALDVCHEVQTQLRFIEELT